jgi:hypothetical protein
MEEVLKSSLGIYQAGFYFVLNLVKGIVSKELLTACIICFIVGWFTYKPRNGGEFGGRLLWYMFAGFYAVVFVFSQPAYSIYGWFFLMGVMLKFSFEILYNCQSACKTSHSTGVNSVQI